MKPNLTEKEVWNVSGLLGIGIVLIAALAGLYFFFQMAEISNLILAVSFWGCGSICGRRQSTTALAVGE